MDITIVVAAGNSGALRTLDELVPQQFGTDDRFIMIIVGGVDKEGKYYSTTVNIGGQGAGGKVHLYAGAVDFTAHTHDQQDDSIQVVTGTSAAIPAVVRFPSTLLTLDTRLTTAGLDLPHTSSVSPSEEAIGTTAAYQGTLRHS